MASISPIRLGSAGPQVSRIALGCMGMSGLYGPSDEQESIATIQAALDSGVNLLDTGDFYGMGHNEMLIARAIEGRRAQALLSVKFGALRNPAGAFLGFDGRPSAVKNFVSYSLQRLKTDHIDVYRPARLDPQVPIEDTVGAIDELIRAGYVRFAGLSEVGAASVRRAQSVHPICDLQIEYSVATRGLEREILPTLRELGVGVTAYGVLSRGLLSGSRPVAQGDFRAHLPRFSERNSSQNRAAVERLAALAAEHGATSAQLAIAWVLAQGEDIVPVIGARTREQLDDALRATELHVSTEAIRRLDEIFAPGQIAGSRYDEAQMRMLDSEREDQPESSRASAS
jgi:aryl-alcohol dehydrogenase-like predicted oxidoreductase